MTTSMTIEERWAVIAPQLEKAGLDTSKILGIKRAQIIGQLETDDVIGADEDVWEEWVDAEIEQHPAWEKPEHKRKRVAQELIDADDWPSYDDDPDADELAQHKYVVKVDSSGEYRALFGCDDEFEVAKVHIGVQLTDAEDAEWVDEVWDLDKDKKITAGMPIVQILEIRVGDTVVRKADNDDAYYVSVNGGEYERREEN